VGAIVADTVTAFGPVADARGTVVDLRLCGPVHAPVDGDAIRRVLLNLLDNAVRYGPPGQTVTVSVERVGIHARIVVEDQGPGIPDARREVIWEPYVRADESPDAPTTGCGIGLAIVSELVALHGGRRSVHARAGGGSSFVVDIPAIDLGADASATPRSNATHREAPLGVR
jgi:signal transduction histidine kinase